MPILTTVNEVEARWNELAEENPCRGHGSEIFDIKVNNSNHLFLDFSAANSQNAKTTFGHLNLDACVDNTIEEKAWIAHFTLLKNGNMHPAKVNYWYEITGNENNLISYKIPKGLSKKSGHKTIQQLPIVNASIFHFLKILYIDD